MIAWPVTVSLAPTTAASATAGWSTRALSTSVVEMRWPGHVHHVVDPAEQPEVALVVELAAVAGEVAALEAAPVGLLVALGVAVDAAQHRGPRPGEGEVAAATLDAMAGVVDHLGLDAREREGGRPRLGGRGARERADHDGAGLGLPPRVDDRAAAAADVLVVPHPRLGVDGLAHAAEQAELGEVVRLGLLGAPLHEGADGGGGGVQDRDAVALGDVPQAVRPGVSGVPS